MQVLPFQKSIQNDFDNHKSSLIILSKGLGIFNIVYNYLNSIKICTGNSILILNLSLSEINCFRQFIYNMDQIQEDKKIDELPRSNSLLSDRLVVINSEMNLNKREVFYSKGGIYIITSRILLIDLLSERLDFARIDGIILLNAESLNVRNWNDAFILQLYKNQNPNGFIKGISQRPEILNQGYFGPGIAMRYIGTTDLFLYPRNNIVVEESFKLSREIKVVEKSVKATEHFYTIQKCIQMLLEKGLHEILKLDANIELTVCDLIYSPTKKIKNKIESLTHDLWYKMSSKIKQIAKDIISIRNLLDLLYLLDASEFFLSLEYIRTLKLIDSSWILTAEFETLYKVSRSRIFKVNDRNIANNSGFENPFTLCLEVNPIYIQLIDVISNIDRELTENDISILSQENSSNYSFPSKKNLDLCSSFDNLRKRFDIKIDEINEEIEGIEHIEKFEYLQIDRKDMEIHSKILENNNFTLQLPEYRVLLIIPDEFYLTSTEVEFLILNGPQHFSAMKLVETFQSIELDLASITSNIISKIIPSFGASTGINSNEKCYSFNQLRLILSKLIQNSNDSQHSFTLKDTIIKFIPNLGVPGNNVFDEIISNSKINPKIIITYPYVNVQGKYNFDFI